MKKYYWILIFNLIFASCNFKKSNETENILSADYYFNQGLNYYYNNNYSAALINIDKAISLDSAVSDYYLNRGAIKELVYDDFISALDDYTKAVELNDKNAVAYYNIGCVLSDYGNDMDAIELFKKAIEIYPDYYPAYFNYACSQFRLKNYDDALKNFETAANFDNTHANNALYYIGLIYKEKGELEKAKAYFEKAVENGNEEAKKEL